MKKIELTAEEVIEEINRLSSILSFEKDDKYELIEKKPEPLGVMQVTQRLFDALHNELIFGKAYPLLKAHMEDEDMIIDNCVMEII